MAQTVCIILRPADRKRLTAVVSDRNRQRKHIERAQVSLLSAEGGSVQQIAAQLGVSRPMVWRWAGASVDRTAIAHRQGLNRGAGTSTVRNNEFNRRVRVSFSGRRPRQCEQRRRSALYSATRA